MEESHEMEKLNPQGNFSERFNELWKDTEQNQKNLLEKNNAVFEAVRNNPSNSDSWAHAEEEAKAALEALDKSFEALWASLKQ